MAHAEPRDEIVETLAGLALFADLTRPEVEAVAHIFEEQWFAEGQRILRQGFVGTAFYLVIDGDAAVEVDGEERNRLGRGDFFGEVSVLLGEPPSADIVARSPLRCLELAGPELPGFLLMYPKVMFRILQAEARKLRSATLWRS
ncbi:MAG: Crp/Fnr family transcriptional regulator [Actinomycetota bacterium]